MTGQDPTSVAIVCAITPPLKRGQYTGAWPLLSPGLAILHILSVQTVLSCAEYQVEKGTCTCPHWVTQLPPSEQAG